MANYEDEDDCGDPEDDRKVLISPRDLRDLLERARDFGRCENSGFPAYLPPLGSWNRTREGWIESRLKCNHKLSEYSPCEVLGIHKSHGAYMGSPVRWVGWDDNYMTPGDPTLPAGYERWYYEKNKEEVDKRLAERRKKNG